MICLKLEHQNKDKGMLTHCHPKQIASTPPGDSPSNNVFHDSLSSQIPPCYTPNRAWRSQATPTYIVIPHLKHFLQSRLEVCKEVSIVKRELDSNIERFKGLIADKARVRVFESFSGLQSSTTEPEALTLGQRRGLLRLN